MGCRLHHAKTYKIEWEGGFFNYNAQEFRKILHALGIEVWRADNSEDEDYGDIEIALTEWGKLRKIINEVKEPDMHKPVLSCLGHDIVQTEDTITWNSLKHWFEIVDQEYDKDLDYIRFSWF